MLQFLKSQEFLNALGIDLSDEEARIARAAGFLAEVTDVTTFFWRPSTRSMMQLSCSMLSNIFHAMNYVISLTSCVKS
ncbi:MAG: hypothetical protein ABI444_00050 [Candidatus Kapaibacterium sp.]